MLRSNKKIINFLSFVNVFVTHVFTYLVDRQLRGIRMVGKAFPVDNNFVAKKSARCYHMLLLTKLIESGTL